MTYRLRSVLGMFSVVAALSSGAAAQQAEPPSAPSGRGLEAAPPVFPSRPPPAAVPRPLEPEARGARQAPDEEGNAPAAGGCRYYQRKLELIV